MVKSQPGATLGLQLRFGWKSQKAVVQAELKIRLAKLWLTVLFEYLNNYYIVVGLCRSPQKIVDDA